MNMIDELTFVAGVGDYAAKRACIMSAAVAMWRMDRGEDLGTATDELDCVCPVVRAFAIRVNDTAWWNNNTERTEVLRPFVDKIIGTADKEKTQLRASLVVDAAVRQFAPMAFEFIGQTEDAAKLRTLAPITDKKSAAAAYAAAANAVRYSLCFSVCATVRAAASAAYVVAQNIYAADGAAYAAKAVYAAEASADGAAYAAYAAKDANAAVFPVRSAALEVLARLCRA